MFGSGKEGEANVRFNFFCSFFSRLLVGLVVGFPHEPLDFKLLAGDVIAAQQKDAKHLELIPNFEKHRQRGLPSFEYTPECGWVGGVYFQREGRSPHCSFYFLFFTDTYLGFRRGWSPAKKLQPAKNCFNPQDPSLQLWQNMDVKPMMRSRGPQAIQGDSGNRSGGSGGDGLEGISAPQGCLKRRGLWTFEGRGVHFGKPSSRIRVPSVLETPCFVLWLCLPHP